MTIWVIEEWTPEREWVPTHHVEHSWAEARAKLREWKEDDPCTRRRVQAYKPVLRER